MKSTLSTLTLLATLAIRGGNAGTIEVTTCDDLIAAVEATATEDTVAKIITSASFDCGIGSIADYSTLEVRTLKIENNALTIEAPDLSENDAPQFWEVRFEIVSGGQLIVVPDVEFDSRTDVSVEKHGGWLNIEAGSKARFLGDVKVVDYKVRSVPDEDSDFSSDQWDGGCVWNQGYFRVDGYMSFERCDNIGGGENSPGKGGAVYNGDTGSILFAAGVLMREIYVTDDTGNSGGGFYNLGKVNIKGDSIFQELYADTSEWYGGAIYNGEGASFNFRDKANAVFIDNGALHGGAVFNEGYLKFSGPALFTLCGGSAIYNAASGDLKLSDGSGFWMNDEGAIINVYGATIDMGDDISFVGNGAHEGTDCTDLYMETEDGVFTCYP